MMPIDDDVHLLFQGTIDDGIDLGEELGRNLGAAVFTNEIVLPGNGKAQVIEALGGGVVDVLRGVFDLPGKGRSDFPGVAKIDAPLDFAGGKAAFAKRVSKTGTPALTAMDWAMGVLFHAGAMLSPSRATSLTMSH